MISQMPVGPSDRGENFERLHNFKRLSRNLPRNYELVQYIHVHPCMYYGNILYTYLVRVYYA